MIRSYEIAGRPPVNGPSPPQPPRHPAPGGQFSPALRGHFSSGLDTIRARSSRGGFLNEPRYLRRPFAPGTPPHCKQEVGGSNPPGSIAANEPLSGSRRFLIAGVRAHSVPTAVACGDVVGVRQVSVSDIAYFGRFPRLDGRGTFLYMAAIHAPGPAGIVHYLSSGGPRQLLCQLRRVEASDPEARRWPQYS